MNFSLASLSCVDGKDHSLPHLLDLMPPEEGKNASPVLRVFGGIIGRIRRWKNSVLG